MIKNNRKWILILLAPLLFISCNEEQFGVGKQNSSVQTNPVETGSTFVCSDHTLIRPPVDLLFLWDNSTSTNYIHPDKKAALNNTLNYISDRFDYQVMIAPLVGSGNNNTYFFSRSGSTPSGVTHISKSSAVSVIESLPLATGAAEAGGARARDLIKNNMNNSIFRPNAYTIVVLLSNEDDDSYVQNDYGSNKNEAEKLGNGITHDLLCLKGGTYNGSYRNSYSSYSTNCSGVPKLNASMMRFLSITPSGSFAYRKISRNIAISQNYSESDWTNLSVSSFSNIFDQVNSVIADQVIKHRYNYWPVAGTNVEVEPSSIQVYRNNGTQLESDEFSYIGKQVNKNTRYHPSLGEPYTGHMIELIGEGEVIFPSCLRVTYNAPAAYYGYCHLSSQPLESSIEVKINGVKIANSKWSLVKSGSSPRYFSSKNIRIKSASDFSEATPAVNRSGYFVKLDPSVVYTDSQTCDVTYHSTGQVN
ncbi:hypothetical protein BIY24_13035 [Halobacteriovorax marinus]|uniref:hypothetical protein n=1 Tax=Halobacteriovorax marinus TaxID=97084 RepID=UPI000BC32983|nr:hypothetical protein [Halobacteriovorax marinus]ATH08837.1 hypothetical protein BIY24_13035 [Halobacteriovorax marinus]